MLINRENLNAVREDQARPAPPRASQWPMVGEVLTLKTPLKVMACVHHLIEPGLEARVFLAAPLSESASPASHASELSQREIDQREIDQREAGHSEAGHSEAGQRERPHGRGALREVWVADRAYAEALLKRRAASVELWRAVSPSRAPLPPSGFERLGSWACLVAPAPHEHLPLVTPEGLSPHNNPHTPKRLPRWMRRELDQLPASPTDESILHLSQEAWALKVASLVDATRPLLELLEELHEAGYTLGGLHPDHFVVTQQPHTSLGVSLCVPLWALDLVPFAEPPALSLSAPLLSAYTGFSPPESYGHFKASPSASADVFSVGAWLFYALTGLAPLSEARLTSRRLPSVRVYQPLVPPELEAVIRRATSPVPMRRYQSAHALKDALRWAAHLASKRAHHKSASLHIELGQELHVGLLKGQYNPVNQDDLFSSYDAERQRGLFVVTDGVSISEHGSGDIASGYVREASAEAWQTLQRSAHMGEASAEEGETISEFSLQALLQESALSASVITSLLNKANQRIGEHVCEGRPTFHAAPENIMAATAVIALIEGDQALLASMGDSRIYLIRDGHIATLMVDDDLATHLMQLGQTPSQAYQAPSSAALVNCVGEFKKSPEGALIPVPVHPQLTKLHLLPGDTLLLCSDGLPDYSGLDEEDAEALMLKAVEGAFSAPKAAFDLIALANGGGGGDNLSCIVLRLHANKEEP